MLLILSHRIQRSALDDATVKLHRLIRSRSIDE